MAFGSPPPDSAPTPPQPGLTQLGPLTPKATRGLAVCRGFDVLGLRILGFNVLGLGVGFKVGKFRVT